MTQRDKKLQKAIDRPSSVYSHMNQTFDGFTPALFLDDDGYWVAYLAEQPHVSAFGESPNNALEELAEAWAAMKESFANHNESPPCAPDDREGEWISIKMDSRLRSIAIQRAQSEGVDVQTWIANALEGAMR